MFSDINPEILKEMGFTETQIKEGIELGLTPDQYLTRIENTVANVPNLEQDQDSTKGRQAQNDSNVVSPFASDGEFKIKENGHFDTESNRINDNTDLVVQGKAVNLENQNDQMGGILPPSFKEDFKDQIFETVELTEEGQSKSQKIENQLKQNLEIDTGGPPPQNISPNIQNDNSKTESNSKPQNQGKEPENSKDAVKKPNQQQTEKMSRQQIRAEARRRKKLNTKMKKVLELRLKEDDVQTKMVE